MQVSDLRSYCIQVYYPTALKLDLPGLVLELQVIFLISWHNLIVKAGSKTAETGCARYDDRNG